jgi:hypothetical protein
LSVPSLPLHFLENPLFAADVYRATKGLRCRRRGPYELHLANKHLVCQAASSDSGISHPFSILEPQFGPRARTTAATMATQQNPPFKVDRYVVMHVATTCDEHGVYVTKDSAEVIELGWILLDANTLDEVGQASP